MSLERISADRIYWTCECVEQVAGDFDEKHLDEKEYYIAEEADREIRKQKRKRCLALSQYCHAASKKYELDAFQCEEYLPSKAGLFHRRAERMRKWFMRWFKIADKFKEE